MDSASVPTDMAAAVDTTTFTGPITATPPVTLPGGNPLNYSKRMHAVGISEEKGAMASNYIAFYGFMNIVAVGLLFYIARS
jgi:hypothetical protein